MKIPVRIYFRKLTNVTMNIWKILISGGILGLLLTSFLMLIVLYRLSPRLQSRRERSLRDQHDNPIPRYGGIALFWGFLGALLLLLCLMESKSAASQKTPKKKRSYFQIVCEALQFMDACNFLGPESLRPVLFDY